MIVDYGLILAAGHGTRMGEIGKIIPKVMWPIFEKRIIDLQIAYFKKLKVRKIFMNLHFQSEKIGKYIAENYKNDLEVLYEKELLDVGGAVLNLKRNVGGHGLLLLNSGDQFLFFDDSSFFDGPKKNETSNLLTVEFEKSEKYNALKIENNYVRGVIPNQELKSKERYLTYSAMSIIDLSKIEKKVKVENFFKTLNLEKKLHRPYILDKYEYFDFGTPRRYLDSMFRILKLSIEKTPSIAMDFFKENQVLNLEKINNSLKSYGYTQSMNTINLSPFAVQNSQGFPAINLGSNEDKTFTKTGIHFNGLWEDII